MIPFIWDILERIVKFTGTESKMVVARTGGGEKEWILFDKYIVAVLQDQKVLKIGCTIMWIYFTELYTLKWLRWKILCNVFIQRI